MNQSEQFEKFLKDNCKVALSDFDLWQAAQAAAVQWQPIETAPIGIPILVWIPTYIFPVLSRRDDDGFNNIEGRRFWDQPTYWMPLPTAPK